MTSYVKMVHSVSVRSKKLRKILIKNNFVVLFSHAGNYRSFPELQMYHVSLASRQLDATL